MDRKPIFGSLLLVLLFFSLVSCIPVTRRASSNTGLQEVFRPPTPVGDSVPTATTIIVSPTVQETPADSSTAAASCRDNLTFLSDVTIPDGTVVQADATLDKRWEVENSGNCNWQENYRIRLIAGPDLGAQQEQALYPARSGSKAVIQILFQAPAESGSYRSAWQAFNPQGEPFGDPFFIDVTVEE